MSRVRHSKDGFTLLELLIATAIFMVICAAMFSLLELSQQKYASETQMSGSFQEARLGMDQLVRDVNISGYPSLGVFSNPPNTASYAVAPFAWNPGYASTTCQVPCSVSPTDKDLIVETNFGIPSQGSPVSWIHYQLQQNTGTGTWGGQTWTLYRGVVTKTVGADPYGATTATGVMTPLVNNVIYNPSGALLSQISTDYPTIFPGGVQPPLFSYTCSTPSGPQPCATAPVPYNTPQYISDVDITLVVMTPYADMQTQAVKLIELTGRGHRSNLGN
jgi:prepilin-type N-terminal cleavage/methylation domain-containing protein